MKELIVGENEAGQRFDKLLKKLLSAASASFLYKMLRKKNITLNGKKADGREIVKAGDQVVFFLSDETYSKFSEKRNKTDGEYGEAYRRIGALKVLYEDENILLVDKPAGLLTQKASPEDLSLNEWLSGFLMARGSLEQKQLSSFRPSVCNRLDRNTSGIVICGISLAGSQEMSRLIRERALRKYYRLLVKGDVRGEEVLDGYLTKDREQNKVTLLSEKEYQSLAEDRKKEYSRVLTRYRALRSVGGATLLEAELITGKTHQLRAHLAGSGHPIIGDFKYGDRSFNRHYRDRFGVKCQLLHAYRLEFPVLEGRFSSLSSLSVTADMPVLYQTILQAEEGKGD